MSEEISNNEKNTLGLVALILAIIGLLLTISVFGSILGIPLLCLALLLGIIALFKRPRGNAVASVILSVLPLGALAYLFGSLFSLLAVPATDFVHWITEESEQNPAIQAAFEQEGFNSFLQSRLEVSMKNADRASLFKNGVSWKSKVSGASTLMFNLIKAEIPGAVEDWVAQYGLPEGMQNFEGPETV
ncbi:MAG: hypothetical protein LBD11_03980 [Candidatus Peribacteria bacterium]|jgi:hypothetical protein|nr:hypothetical protein [Candidatus Peribacteria bacterium]